MEKIPSSLSAEEAKDRDLMSLESLLLSFGIILVAFGLVGEFGNLLTVLAAIAMIGWRQLSLFDLQHKSLHGELFSDPKLNDEVGKWLCSYTLYSNPEDHRAIYQLYRQNPFLVRRPRRERLFINTAGLVGGQRLLAVLATNLGLAYVSEKGELKFIDRRTLNARFILENLKDNYLRVLGAHLLMMVLLSLLGMLSAYFLWLAAYLTGFSLLLELRREKELRSLLDASVIVDEGEISESPTTAATATSDSVGKKDEIADMEELAQLADEIIHASTDSDEINDEENEEAATGHDNVSQFVSREKELFIPGEVPVLKRKAGNFDERFYSEGIEDSLLNVPLIAPSTATENSSASL